VIRDTFAILSASIFATSASFWACIFAKYLDISSSFFAIFSLSN